MRVDLVLLAGGLLGLGVAALSERLRRLPLSEPLLGLLAGIALGPSVAGLLTCDRSPLRGPGTGRRSTASRTLSQARGDRSRRRPASWRSRRGGRHVRSVVGVAASPAIAAASVAAQLASSLSPSSDGEPGSAV